MLDNVADNFPFTMLGEGKEFASDLVTHESVKLLLYHKYNLVNTSEALVALSHWSGGKVGETIKKCFGVKDETFEETKVNPLEIKKKFNPYLVSPTFA